MWVCGALGVLVHTGQESLVSEAVQDAGLEECRCTHEKSVLGSQERERGRRSCRSALKGDHPGRHEKVALERRRHDEISTGKRGMGTEGLRGGWERKG